jgi:hypothetical protein
VGDADGWDLSKDRTEGPAAGESAAGPPAAEAGPGEPGHGTAPYGQAPYGQPGWAPPPPGQAYPPGPYPPGQHPPPGGHPPGAYPPGAYPQGPYPQGPYPQGPYPPGYPLGYPPLMPRTSGRAVAVLCCGIGSLLLLFTCFVGFVPAIVALCLAPGAKREIEQSQGMITGLGLVQAGRICAWITIVLTVLGVAALVAFLSWGSGSWPTIGPIDINTY